MRAKIEKVGDGFGLLLPKELLDACGFGTEATVTVQNKTLVISARPRRPREGWAETLQAIPQSELDLDSAELQAFRETPHEWTATEWQWPDSDTHEKV
jgi:antitoxin component of MazEF toxin-antitoxin module